MNIQLQFDEILRPFQNTEPESVLQYALKKAVKEAASKETQREATAKVYAMMFISGAHAVLGDSKGADDAIKQAGIEYVKCVGTCAGKAFANAVYEKEYGMVEYVKDAASKAYNAFKNLF